MSSGVGTYDLLGLAREKLTRAEINSYLKEQKAGTHSFEEKELEQALGVLESRAVLAGKSIKDLEQEDELYREVLGLWRAELQQKAERKEATKPDEIESFLQNQLNRADENLQRELKTEKEKGTAGKALGVLVGSAVGSGFLARVLGYKTALREAGVGKLRPEEVGVKKPEVGIKRPEELGIKKSEIEIKKPEEIGVKRPEVEVKRPEVEVKGEQMIVHAGRRGIEGALLDLKDAEPEKYQKMLRWLEENYSSKAPGGNTPDKLIHRFMLDYADEHEFTIGGGGQDLNRIFGAEIGVSPQGEVNIDPGKLEFMRVAKEGIPSPVKPSLKEFISPEAKPPISEMKIGAPLELTPEQLGKTAQIPEMFKYQPPESPLPPAGEAVDLSTFTKTSDALIAVLGEKYPEFINGVLRISPEHLNEIQNKTLAEFLDYYQGAAATSEEIEGKFGGFAEILDLHIKTNHLSESYLRAKKIRDFVLEFGRAYKETS